MAEPIHDTAVATMEAEIRLGDEAIQFFNSNLGRYVIGCSKQEVDEIKDLLLTETDSETISRLQQRAAVAEMAVEWLKEVIFKRNDHLAAEDSIDDYETDNPTGGY